MFCTDESSATLSIKFRHKYLLESLSVINGKLVKAVTAGTNYYFKHKLQYRGGGVYSQGIS